MVFQERRLDVLLLHGGRMSEEAVGIFILILFAVFFLLALAIVCTAVLTAIFLILSLIGGLYGFDFIGGFL